VAREADGVVRRSAMGSGFCCLGSFVEINSEKLLISVQKLFKV
jgi:hypothetical protein